MSTNLQAARDKGRASAATGTQCPYSRRDYIKSWHYGRALAFKAAADMNSAPEQKTALLAKYQHHIAEWQSP